MVATRDYILNRLGRVDPKARIELRHVKLRQWDILAQGNPQLVDEFKKLKADLHNIIITGRISNQRGVLVCRS